MVLLVGQWIVIKQAVCALVLDQCEAARLHDNAVGLQMVMKWWTSACEGWHICPGDTKQGHSLAVDLLRLLISSDEIEPPPSSRTHTINQHGAHPSLPTLLQATGTSATTTTAMVIISSKRPPVRTCGFCLVERVPAAPFDGP